MIERGRDQLNVLIVTADLPLAQRLHRWVWAGGHIASYAQSWDGVPGRLGSERDDPDVVVLDAKMARTAPSNLLQGLGERSVVVMGDREEIPRELSRAARLDGSVEGSLFLGTLKGFLPREGG